MKKILTVCFVLSAFYSSAQYMIYGVTEPGYVSNQLEYGTIFSYNPATHKQTTLFRFNDTDGRGFGRMIYASDSLLYGLGRGGKYGEGMMYSFNPKTNIETVLINFDSTNGYAGDGGNELIQAKDGLLYGTAWAGGKYGKGVLFSYDIHTHKDSIRCNFNDSTARGITGGTYMDLWQDPVTGILYGVTELGGYPGQGGVIYGFNPATNKLVRYYVGTLNGINPWNFSGGFTQANNGLLYGLSWSGGSTDSGTIYSFNITSHAIQTVYSFSKVDGALPDANELVQLSNGLLYGGTRHGGDLGGDGVLFSFNLTTHKEKVLKTFHDTDGSQPWGRLIQYPGSSLLYGVTVYGGVGNFPGYGVLFSYDTGTSTYTKLFDFTGLNGAYPVGLTLVKDTSVHFIHTAVSEVKSESGKLKVYPNPSNGMFTFQSSVVSGQFSVEIYNMLGEKIRSETLSQSNNRINLTDKSDGIYLYRVITNSGKLIGEGKIIIQR